MKHTSFRFFLPIALLALAVLPVDASAADTAHIRITNIGTTVLRLDDGTTVAPGATTDIEVPADAAGTLAGKPYPALRPGSSYRMKVDGSTSGGTRPVPPKASSDPGARPARHTLPSYRKPGIPGKTVATDLPVLWVRGDGQGGCTRLPFHFQRDTASGSPLRIVVGDDAPGGAGDAIRASLWQAATTAAFLRNDLLDGVRIECDYSGYVDGPSAGGVTCLAILSAIDGRPFPDDFAMTGTIMADGTVGLVGGVARKLKGAADAGIKRVCIPSFGRFEEQEDESYVDLHALARELGLELRPVSNVEEAYAFAHNLPAPVSSTPPHVGLYGEAESIEKTLLETISTSVRVSGDAFARFRDEKEDADENSDVSMAFKIMSDNRGLPPIEIARNAGMLHVALWLSSEQVAFWAGQQPLQRRIHAIRRYDLDTVDGYGEWKEGLGKRISRVQGKIDSLERAWFDETGAGGRFSPLAAQCGLVNLNSEFLNAIACAILPEVTQAEIDAGEDGKLLAMLMKREALCAWYETLADSLDRGWRRVAASLPARDPVRPPSTVESFFHSARVAQDKVIDEQFEKVKDTLFNISDDWSLYTFKRREAEAYHALALNLAGDDSATASFAMVLSVMAQIDAIAHGAKASTLFGNELGMERDDDGSLGYSNTPYATYLLRTAREQAVRALVECDAANVPCPRVRAHLETGDYYRDSDHHDRFDVLSNYWCAMLKAKALRMIFAK